MSENLLAYWRSQLDEDKEIEITADGYMFKYIIANQYSGDVLQNWVCCTSKKKLYSFLKNIILPSISISKTVGIIENIAFLDVMSYDETIDILSSPKIENSITEINRFKSSYDEINKLEMEDAPFDKIKEFVTKITLEVDYREGIFVEVEVFKNISDVGKELIKAYEEDGMIDVLESQIELSKVEIENLFNNITDNKFMMKKINTLLNERLSI